MPSRFRFTCLIAREDQQAATDRAGGLQKQLFNIGVDMDVELVPVTAVRGTRWSDRTIRSHSLNSARCDRSISCTSFWHSVPTGEREGLPDFHYSSADAALDKLRGGDQGRRRQDRGRRAAARVLRRSPGRVPRLDANGRAVSRSISRPERTRSRRDGHASAVAAGGRADREAMKSITSRFVMLIATAAIAPLVIYGVVSMRQLRSGTEESVTKGNLGIATRAAAQINQYVENNQRVLRSIALELRTAGLEPWQQSRILKDTVLDFPEFREVSILDADGQAQGTSRFGQPTVTIPDRAKAAGRDVFVAPLKQDNDGLPTTTIAVRMEPGNAGIRLGRRRARARRALADGRSDQGRRVRARARSSPRAAGSSPTETPTRNGSWRRRRVTARIEQTAARDPGEARPTSRNTRRRIGRVRARCRRDDSEPRLDGHGRAAHVGGLRRRHASRAAAPRRHRRGPSRHDHRRLAVGPVVPDPHLRAAPRDAGDRRRPSRRARHHDRPGRAQTARRLLQLDGRQHRPAAGGRQEAGTPGDVRPHRCRPRPRSVASDSEHRQQLQADSEDVRRRGVPRDVQADGRARDGRRSSACSTTSATSPGRSRSSGSRSRSTARSPRWSSRCSSTPRRRASRCGPSSRRRASTSRATSSRSAASIAT